MKVLFVMALVLAFVCFGAMFVFHWGTSKYERMNAGRLQMDPKKKKRISLGYWSAFLGVALLFAAMLLGIHGGMLG